MPEYELVHIRLLDKRSADDDGLVPNKRIHLSAFGKELNLNLKQNTDFNERAQNMKVFMAETRNGKLKYVEAPSSSTTNAVS